MAANLKVLTGLLVALGVLELLDARLIDAWGFAVGAAEWTSAVATLVLSIGVLVLLVRHVLLSRGTNSAATQ